jgi:hypothetical protein
MSKISCCVTDLPNRIGGVFGTLAVCWLTLYVRSARWLESTFCTARITMRRG